MEVDERILKVESLQEKSQDVLVMEIYYWFLPLAVQAIHEALLLCQHCWIMSKQSSNIPKMFVSFAEVLESDHILYRSYAIIILHVYNFLTQKNFTYLYIYM